MNNRVEAHKMHVKSMNTFENMTENEHRKIWHRNNWKMTNKSLKLLIKLIICMCLISNLLAQELFTSKHNGLDDTIISAEQNETHRKGRCKSSSNIYFDILQFSSLAFEIEQEGLLIK